ncbi:hypothetical protein PAM7066_01948 [Palleronia marisminoris]|uniref:Uncharacterized protein n=1 Tax=Palleronia marisminoris TaxID=315423 RepID=A0A1Y5STT1_9RHOB|nr:hypothetical protein PAM7066_01948 [Palleronia marisminoris]
MTNVKKLPVAESFPKPTSMLDYLERGHGEAAGEPEIY